MSNLSEGFASLPRKRLKVGIIDLVARQPTRSPYARIANPNYTSYMPQVLAVWTQQMGHEVHYFAYTGFEDLHRELPKDTDILFISCFTQNAYTAYAISNIFRQQGVVTVLGGPHARSYSEDARHFFDYVLGLTDKDLIQNLLSDFSPKPDEGCLISASQQPKELPTVQERWPFLEKNLAKTWFVQVVPMIGSLGCPYTCSFCIDSQIDYQPLPYDRIKEDLAFLSRRSQPTIVGWYDPNFGVRFDEYLDLIESTVTPGSLTFAAESTLSLLTEDHLKRLKHNNFIAMLPGIESWFDFNGKSKQGKNYGMEKVNKVADQVNRVLHYVPYVQTNHIFGLDCDEGTDPFELTKKFVDLCPGVYPNYNFITAFGNSAPLNREFLREGRVVDVPFPFLDGNSGLNVRPKNYTVLELYDHLCRLAQYTLSSSHIMRRFKANKHPFPRWMNVLRALFASKGKRGNFGEIRQRLKTDAEFQKFYSGESLRPPSFYHMKIRSMLGPFYSHLPHRVLNFLESGEGNPNPRLIISQEPALVGAL